MVYGMCNMIQKGKKVVVGFTAVHQLNRQFWLKHLVKHRVRLWFHISRGKRKRGVRGILIVEAQPSRLGQCNRLPGRGIGA